MNNTTEYIEKIRRGDITRITEMLDGAYARRTVEAQLRGERTLQPIVREKADLYFDTMDKLLTPNNTEQ